MCFSVTLPYYSTTYLPVIVGPIDVKRKGSAWWRLDTGYTMWPWALTSLMTLALDITRSNFKIAVSQESLVWLMWNESELIRFWADCMTLPFDNTHDIDLEVSRSEFEIALSPEWDGRLTWNKRDESHPFMTMILTFMWPWWGGWMNQIVTGVTSNVSVALTYLVYYFLLWTWLWQI